MTRQSAESMMLDLALELFPGLSSGYSLERMSRMCKAYEIITGRAAKPVLNSRGYYLPELED